MPPVTRNMIPGIGAYHVVIGADRLVVRAYWVGRVISHNVIHFHLILSQTLLFGVHLHIDAPTGFAIFHASTCDVYSPIIVPSFDITASSFLTTHPSSGSHGHTIERSKLTVPRIERPRPAHHWHAAGRTGASEDYGPVRNAHPHRPVIFRRPNSPALMVHK